MSTISQIIEQKASNSEPRVSNPTRGFRPVRRRYSQSHHCQGLSRVDEDPPITLRRQLWAVEDTQLPAPPLTVRTPNFS
ncbi:hypothetical protein C2S52_009177 [Perilla frutescens var. hirtella]|nr:hypothetical protein C2S51_017308 [Perilla frutescens var. frutescens]KAH6784218.1 hypothetical protein C2S52_009177 [Perilla frutescens var. hirtella]